MNIIVSTYQDIYNYAFDLLKKHSKCQQIFKLNLNWQHLPNLEGSIIEIKKKLQNQPAYFFISIQEPITIIPKGSIGLEFIILSHLLKKHGIFNCNFLVTNFMVNSFNESINFLNNNFYDWNFKLLEINIPAIMQKTVFEEKNINNDLFLHECIYKLSHLNITHRMHRQLYSKFLIKENIHQNNLIAINLKKNWNHKNVFDPDGLTFANNSLNFEDWFYNKNLSDLWRDIKLEPIKNKDIDEKYDDINLNFLKKASLCVVSETVFNYSFNHITEKTLQPIIAKRPFIIIGPKNTLKFLKDQGFKTFSNIIDESYDQIDDPNERLQKIMEITKEYNQKTLDQTIQDLVMVKEEVAHNYNLVIQRLKNLKKNVETSIIQYVNKCENTR